MPPRTDCSAIKSCGGVRSNSTALATELLPRLGSSAMLMSESSYLPLTFPIKPLLTCEEYVEKHGETGG